MNALHYVAQHGHDREASLLLKAGINVDAINNVSTVSYLRKKIIMIILLKYPYGKEIEEIYKRLA